MTLHEDMQAEDRRYRTELKLRLEECKDPEMIQEIVEIVSAMSKQRQREIFALYSLPTKHARHKS